MPIKIVDTEKETDYEVARLCGDKWEMPIQIETFRNWLAENATKLPKGKYNADLGFSPRDGALGGGEVICTEMMQNMILCNMELYLSEYPACDED